jgi:hypothetical protein
MLFGTAYVFQLLSHHDYSPYTPVLCKLASTTNFYVDLKEYKILYVMCPYKFPTTEIEIKNLN